MPIVDVEGIGRIEFPDSMSRAQIDAAIANEILPAYEKRAAANPQLVASLAPRLDPSAAPIAPNPFSRGTMVADTSYKVGDNYHYRMTDLFTKAETRTFGRRVTAVTDTEVIYNRGAHITDLLGNTLKNNRGQTFTGSQIFVAEYRLGRAWSTIYRGTRRDLEPDVWVFNLKVTAREPYTVPAGTFDAFKVEGHGSLQSKGHRFAITYWVAPDKVRTFLALEMIHQARGNRYINTDRSELVSFQQS